MNQDQFHSSEQKEASQEDNKDQVTKQSKDDQDQQDQKEGRDNTNNRENKVENRGNKDNKQKPRQAQDNQPKYQIKGTQDTQQETQQQEKQNQVSKKPQNQKQVSQYQVKGTQEQEIQEQSDQVNQKKEKTIVSQYKIKGSQEPEQDDKPQNQSSQYKIKGTQDPDNEPQRNNRDQGNNRDQRNTRQNRDAPQKRSNQEDSYARRDEYDSAPRNQRQQKNERTQEQIEEQDRVRQEKKQQMLKNRAEREAKPQGKYSYDKSLVTLETVIPEVKKHELIKKPVRDDLDHELDELDRQIDKIHHDLHDYSEEVRRDAYNLKTGKSEEQPIRQLLNSKKVQKKAVRAEFNKIKEDHNEKKKLYADLQDQADAIKQKMKNFDKTEDITTELKRLKYRQQNDKINAHEEKTICKQINDLEKSLPYAQPLEVLEKKIEITRQEKGKIGAIMNTIYKSIQDLDEDINAYNKEIDQLHEEKETTQKTLDPKIQAKNDEFRDKIDVLKEKKKEIVKQYHDTYDKYEEQELFLNHIDWLHRQKDRLLKVEEQRKYEEQKVKRDEAYKKKMANQEAKQKAYDESENSRIKINPFQGQIELCEQLITYCQKLQPQQAGVKVQKIEEKKQNVDAVLKSEEWKRDKVTVIKGKGERTEDEFAALATTKVKTTQQKSHHPEPQKESSTTKLLEHAIQTINLFDSIKVSVPFVAVDLEKTIKLLEERKQYYQSSPQEDSRQKSNQDDDQNQDGNNNRQKDKRGKAKNQRVDINEREFPTF